MDWFKQLDPENQAFVVAVMAFFSTALLIVGAITSYNVYSTTLEWKAKVQIVESVKDKIELKINSKDFKELIRR